MDSNIPTLLIIRKTEYVSQVLNKLPNKTKLYNIYLYNLLEPLIEYGFSIYNENNTSQFKIIVCDSNINVDNIISNTYFDRIEGLIICSDNYDNYDNFIKSLNVSENIYIWFNKEYIDIDDNNLHYLFSDNNWKNRIFNHIDTPFTSYISNQCNIL